MNSPDVQGLIWIVLTERSQHIGPHEEVEAESHGHGVEDGPHDGESEDGGNVAEEISAVETECRVEDDWGQEDVEEEVRVEVRDELVLGMTQAKPVVSDGGEQDPQQDQEARLRHVVRYDGQAVVVELGRFNRSVRLRLTITLMKQANISISRSTIILPKSSHLHMARATSWWLWWSTTFCSSLL